MHRSTALARLITIVIAVIVSPIAVTLLTAGGRYWQFGFFRYADEGPDLGEFVGPVLLQLLGILLLAAVVFTGIWSSAGLLATGALGAVPLALALVPALFVEVYRVLPRGIGEPVGDALSFGVPLFLLPALGAMGIAVALLRRRPEAPGGVLPIVALIGTPVLLLAGAALAAWGHGAGTLRALVEFRFDVNPPAALALLGGLALVGAGIVLSRWAPLALLLPAVALMAASLLAVLPGGPAWFFLPAAQDLSRSVTNLVLLGTGTAAGVCYLVFSLVLLRVRARTRRALPEHGAPV